MEQDTNESTVLSASRINFLYQESTIKPKPKISFEFSDLNCLAPTQWLNDAVINSYMNLMKSKTSENIGSTNTFFYAKLERDGPESAVMWEGIKGEKLNIYEKFLIPVCSGAHWILICCDFVQNELQVLDPLGGMYHSKANTINGFLSYQGIPTLPVKHPRVPSQHNGYDCGVFLLSNARCHFFNNGIYNFSQGDIPNMRRKIKQELLDCVSNKD